MNTFVPLLLKVILLASFLFQSYYFQQTNEDQCLGNVSPADESESANFELFSTELERYSGLGLTPYSLTLSCNTVPCTVNPNGSAIWNARMHLYSSNMMHSNNGSGTTLDGCLCYSSTVADFQTCMTEVRSIMIGQLETVLVGKFKEIIEADCGLFDENCHV